jgi:hypothetical protein
MSRRTFPRAAAGLVAAAVGSQSPALAQAPNPWRGEAVAIPTAPAPRPVAAPRGELVFTLDFNSTGGVTGSVQVNTAPAPQLSYTRSVCVDLDPATGTCPAAGQLTAQAQTAPTKPLPDSHVKELVTAAVRQADTPGGQSAQAVPTPPCLVRYTTTYTTDPAVLLQLRQGSQTDPVVIDVGSRRAKPVAAPAPVLQRIGYTVPLTATPVMPPPAPLPTMRTAPQVIVPAGVQVEVTLPPAIPPAVK